MPAIMASMQQQGVISPSSTTTIGSALHISPTYSQLQDLPSSLTNSPLGADHGPSSRPTFSTLKTEGIPKATWPGHTNAAQDLSASPSTQDAASSPPHAANSYPEPSSEIIDTSRTSPMAKTHSLWPQSPTAYATYASQLLRPSTTDVYTLIPHNIVDAASPATSLIAHAYSHATRSFFYNSGAITLNSLLRVSRLHSGGSLFLIHRCSPSYSYKKTPWCNTLLVAEEKCTTVSLIISYSFRP